MAAGKGGKHNKAHSSLEFNEYRYQMPDLLEERENKRPRNVESRSTGYRQQVIYRLWPVFFFSVLSL